MYESIYNKNFKKILKKNLRFSYISQLKMGKNEQDTFDEQSTHLLKKPEKIN